MQHECDHLDGVLHPARMQDPTAPGFLDELVASGRMPVRIPLRPKDHVRGETALLRRLARVA